jgi:hypothetical protein
MEDWKVKIENDHMNYVSVNHPSFFMAMVCSIMLHQLLLHCFTLLEFRLGFLWGLGVSMGRVRIGSYYFIIIFN